LASRGTPVLEFASRHAHQAELVEAEHAGEEMLWKGLIPSTHPERHLICCHASGGWYFMTGFYQTRALVNWPAERQKEWHRQNPHRLYRALRAGGMFLIQDTVSTENGISAYLLCQDQNYAGGASYHSSSPLATGSRPVFARDTVVLGRLDSRFSAGLGATRELARKIANDEVTSAILSLRDAGASVDDPEYQAAVAAVKAFLQKQAADAFELDTRFENLARESFGITTGEQMWATVPFQLPHDVVLEDFGVPGDQLWDVDREVS